MPAPGAFHWRSDKTITEKVKSFPAVIDKNGLSSRSSQMTIQSKDWESKTFTCSAERGGNGRDLSKRVCQNSEPMYPTVQILLSSCEDKTEENIVPLVCLVSSFRPGDAVVTWLKNGNKFSGNGFNPVMAQNGIFMGKSVLNVSKESWNREDTYTCQVTHQKETIMYNISKCLACPSTFVTPTVILEKYYHGDSSNDKGTIVCSVFGSNLNSNHIFLKVDGKKSEKTGRSDGKDANKNNIKVIYTLTHKEWESITRVSCVVTQPCSHPEVTKEIDLKINAADLKNPAVSLSKLIPKDILEANAATLICDVTGFYPEDISIKWERNSGTLKPTDYTNTPVTCSGKTCSAMSLLKVTKGEVGVSYDCVIQHRSNINPLRKTIQGVFDEEPARCNETAQHQAVTEEELVGLEPAIKVETITQQRCPPIPPPCATSPCGVVEAERIATEMRGICTDIQRLSRIMRHNIKKLCANFVTDISSVVQSLQRVSDILEQLKDDPDPSMSSQ
ncbi:hypothetical protein FKM82_029685 [Ascaphus truei]